MKRLDNYRQNIEHELLAIIFALAGVAIMFAGLVWATVFALRWVLL